MDQEDIEFSDYEEPNVTSISFEDEMNRFYRDIHDIHQSRNLNEIITNPSFLSYMSLNLLNNDPFYDEFNMHNSESIYDLINILDIIDPIDRVINDSFEAYHDENLVKTDRHITIESKEFASLDEPKTKECSICISDFENISMISIPDCGHIFHTECIKEWYKYKTDCPICREKIE